MQCRFSTRPVLVFLATVLTTSAGGLRANEPAGTKEAELIEARKIWDEAPHNAFTDLIRFNDRWFCVFREGAAHVSPDGALRVITSVDGKDWTSAALIKSETADLRDAKITLTPDGRLMLSGAAALHDTSKATHQSLVWFSSDGKVWSEAHPVADPDFWMWRTTWHKGVAYGVGYGCRETNKFIRLYKSDDGRKFSTVVENLFDQGYPNETSLIFREDDSCLCLCRRDEGTATAQLGVSKPPYTDWTWKDLGRQLGGPHMLRLPDGRFVAAGRLYDDRQRTSLLWLDPEAGTLKEFLPLPSGGDTSYPGLVLHNGLLWVSYYASHEDKTNIYLAKVKLP